MNTFDMTEDKSTAIITVVVVLIVGVLIGLTFVNYRFSEENPGGNDFLARWMGARYWIVEGVSPYDQRVTEATQYAIYGRSAYRNRGEDVGHFVYPLYSMVFFAPFGLLDYLPARALWMTLLEISLFLLVILSLRMADWFVSPLQGILLILFAFFWYHSIRGIIVGQFAIINSLLIVLSIFLILKKQDVLAGLVLFLTTIKPQMTFLLIPFVLIWAIDQRRREIIYGLLIGCGVLGGATLLLMPDWPVQMLKQIFDYPNYTSIGSPVSILAGVTPGLRKQISWFLHGLIGVYLIIEWMVSLKKDIRWFYWTVLQTLVVTNLIAFRTATTHFVILLPAIFLVFKVMEERWKRAGKWTVWMFVLLIFLGLWGLFFRTVQGNIEQPVMYLPVPLFCFVGLLWIKWWYVRPQKLFFDEISQMK